jgi:hypothetical protein
MEQLDGGVQVAWLDLEVILVEDDLRAHHASA